MKRLRSKIAALFVLIAMTGILGTTVVKTRSILADKRNYLIEFNSVAAPHVASNISHHLVGLKDQFTIFDDILRNNSGSGGAGRLLTLAFRRLKGVENIAVYDQQGFVASVSAPENRAPKPAYGEAALSRYRATRMGALFGGDAPVYSAWVNGRLYIAQLRPDVFSEYFELARARSVMVVGVDRTFISGGTNTRVGLTDPSALSQLLDAVKLPEREVVIAKEVETSRGIWISAAMAPIPTTDGAVVLVQAPLTDAVEMVRQVLRTSLPLIGLMTFLAVVLAILFTRKLVQPIEELTEATAKIAEGHWSVSIASRPTDEIGRLVTAFGRMGRELEMREESLKNAHAELLRSERLAAVGMLSAGVAHEVKNPLNSIMGFTELMKLEVGGRGNENVDKYLDIIQSESRRATGIISELLTFARNKPPVLKPEKVGELVDFAYDLYANQATKAGITLTRNVCEPGVTAGIDRDQMCQVLANIVTNAIHALEELPEGRPRRLALRLVREDGFAVIEIADTGPGISKENLSKIFDPFFSTKKTGKGTGLGLSVTYSIVDQHHGRIEVASQVGVGTTFRVKLPALNNSS